MNDYYNCASGLEILPENLSDKKFRDFTISRNKLKTLKNSPRIVLGSYIAYKNKLVSLHGSPVFVGSIFHCSENPLNTLSGSPQKVGNSFLVSHCLLFSVDFLPLKTPAIIL